MNEDNNRMSAKNMAIVMSPNLFSFPYDDPMQSLKMAQKVHGMLFLILHHIVTYFSL
jgi:hypothetical protein